MTNYGSMEGLNIFVVGLDDRNLARLRTIEGAGNYTFHPLFTHREIRFADRFPVKELLADGRRQLRVFPWRVDAVVGYIDFPVSTVLPVLREEVGLPGPSLEAVLKCEHKYWSRLEQSRAIPEHIPGFCAVDPFAPDALSRISLDFPFWIKPVKSVLSHLGFLVRDQRDFEHAIDVTRSKIRRFGDPFNLILEHSRLPREIASVDGNHCIAEALISAGRQCTLEGYSHRGRIRIYGAVDSWREGSAESSFSRYQYPSTLPETVQGRMTEIAARIISWIGYDDAPFNIEFYWEKESGRIWLLEINSRISKSHAPLFKMVDGFYNHQVMVELGLGREPDLPGKQGKFACAAKCMVRREKDAVVIRVPSREEITALESDIPGVEIIIEVNQGMLLSQLRYQDSYSYEVAVIFVGGADHFEMDGKYKQVMERLPLVFADVDESGQRPAPKAT